jgi:hypothetical protein
MSLFTWWNETEQEPADKLLEDYSLRVSPKDKHSLDSMPKPLKAKMNVEIRLLIKFYAHLAKFDPNNSGDE